MLKISFGVLKEISVAHNYLLLVLYNLAQKIQTFSTIIDPPTDKTNKMSAPSKDSDQPGHLPSLIRVFAVHSMRS